MDQERCLPTTAMTTLTTQWKAKLSAKTALLDINASTVTELSTQRSAREDTIAQLTKPLTPPLKKQPVPPERTETTVICRKKKTARYVSQDTIVREVTTSQVESAVLGMCAQEEQTQLIQGLDSLLLLKQAKKMDCVQSVTIVDPRPMLQLSAISELTKTLKDSLSVSIVHSDTTAQLRV